MTVNKSDVRLFLQIVFYLVFLLSLLPFTTAVNARVRSEVEGEGFHRTLKYYVDTGDFQNKSCHLAIFVRLPPSLYTNVDELADLRRLHKNSACSEGEIDVELFAEKSHYQNVTICSRLTSTKTILTVPVHQRYQFATSSGKAFNIGIPKPRLLLGCRDRLKDHRVSKIKICWPCIEYSKKWRDVMYKWEGDNNFYWKIPVGKTSRKFEITCITLFTTLAGAAYILWSIYRSQRVPKDRKLKE